MTRVAMALTWFVLFLWSGQGQAAMRVEGGGLGNRETITARGCVVELAAPAQAAFSDGSKAFAQAFLRLGDALNPLGDPALSAGAYDADMAGGGFAEIASVTNPVSIAGKLGIFSKLKFWRWGRAANSGAPAFKTWNQFQSGTAGQFATRAEAGAAWSVYKEANWIVTGATRSTAAHSEFLRGMAESGKSPSWMNQWLQQGKVPPGYHVDHIRPLSIGGADTPANMRLLDIDMHRMHHRYYRPWE